MKVKFYTLVLIVSALILVIPFSVIAGGPKGAKAIFESGEGPSARISVYPKQRPPLDEPGKREKYIGIFYQLLLVSDEGQFNVVTQSRVFRSGERIKLLVRTNRPGYMTIFNIGPSGNTHLLFNEYVEAFAIHEIPKTTNLKFVGPPGTEKILIMLSNEPNPIVQQPAVIFQPGESPPGPSSSPGYPTSPSGVGSPIPAAPAQSIVESIEGLKTAKGAKDIVAEDNMKSSYAVISPRNNYRPVNMGVKDIVLESSTGNNYGVIPASTLAGGGILALEIKLKHRLERRC
jgi:hypothetical protein